MRFPQVRVLHLYAEHGEQFSRGWDDRTVYAQVAVEDVEKRWQGVWPQEATATEAIALLRQFIEPFATRDRGWADVYTAQTAVDHGLIVLTEDVSDYSSINGVEYLVDYDQSRT